MASFRVEGYFYEDATADFEFYASTDGSSYTQVTPSVSSSYPSTWEQRTYTVDSLPAGTKFVKITWPPVNNYEWEPKLGRVEIDKIRPIDRSGWTATASHTSSTYPTPPSNAIDGDTSTEWTSGVALDGTEITLEVDMGTTQTLQKVEVLHRDPDCATDTQTFPNTIAIDAYDGSSWNEIATFSGAMYTEKSIPATSTPKFRIRDADTTTSTGWWKVMDLQAYK